MEVVRTADGTALNLWRWPAVARPARGVVLLVHGLGEHVGRYQALATALAAEGFTVCGHDQRGHGESPGPRGVIPSADALLADLGAVIDAVRVRGLPLVLLGHSMGGAVAARFVAEGLEPTRAPWWRAVEALVLSSPALDPGLRPAQKALLALAGPLVPSLALGNGLDPSWVSRDPAVVAAYRADPLVHDRIAPRLARFIVDAGAFVRARAAPWRTPTLLLWAGADRCVAPAGSAAFAADAPAAVVQSQCFAELAHEIFNEPERAQVVARLMAFLDGVAPRVR